MLEISAYVNCCFLCSVIFIEYYSTMHCNEVLQACRVDPIYCDIYFVLPSAFDISRYILSCRAIAIYDLPINLRYIHKRVPSLIFIQPACQQPEWYMSNSILFTCISASKCMLYVLYVFFSQRIKQESFF